MQHLGVHRAVGLIGLALLVAGCGEEPTAILPDAAPVADAASADASVAQDAEAAPDAVVSADALGSPDAKPNLDAEVVPADVGPGGCVRNSDCNDGIQCTTDVCHESTATCTNLPPDRDGDLHAAANCVDAAGNALGDDCDDGDPRRNPRQSGGLRSARPRRRL